MQRQPSSTWPEAVAATRARSSIAAAAAVAGHEDWVDVVRVAAIFLIVFGHTLNLDQRFIELPVGSAAWFAIDAITAGIRWALPVFVMISGFFLLNPGKELDWSKYYRRRAGRIAWPLLAWTVLYLGIGIHDDLASGRSFDAAKVIRSVIAGSPYYHLWYLYMLPGLYLVSPFVKLATDRMSPGQLTVGVGLCFAVTVFSATMDGLYAVPNVTHIDDFPRYLGYFLAGHWLGRILQPPRTGLSVAVLIAAFLATAAAAYLVAEIFSPARALRLFGFGNPTIIALSLAAYALIRRLQVPAAWRKWLGIAGEMSFGIYLVHPAILNTLRYWSYPTTVPQFAAEVACVLAISVAVITVMQRIPVSGDASEPVPMSKVTGFRRDLNNLFDENPMSQACQAAKTRFAPAAVQVTPLPNGGIRLSSPMALQPYPSRLSDILQYWASRSPNRVFLAERRESGDGWRELTYAAALAGMRAIGQALLDRELSCDRPVVILSDNGVDHALLALAGMHVGVPVVPLSPAYSLASENFVTLRRILDLVRPGLIFAADGARFMPALTAVRQRAEIAVATHAPAGMPCTPLAGLLETSAGPAVDAALARVGPDTIAKILFSSGSTDLPKGVITTQRMMCANQTALAQVWPFLVEQPPVLVDWLPWNHVFGGSFCFNLTLFHGGTLYIDDGKPTGRLINRTVANLREISPTIYFNVPLGFDMLLPHLERDAALRERFFARLDLLFYAAAALPTPSRVRLQQLALRTRGEAVPVISAWGATETAPVATAVHFDTERTSMIGLPIPGCVIKMVPNNGKLELRVRGPHVTPGYWRREDLTNNSFDEEGFLRIGDAGRLADDNDPRRGIEFVGRLTEDFKLNSGIWVSPGPIRMRAIAAGSPVIQDAVVTGHDRAQIGLLIVPNEQGCRSLIRDAPETTPMHRLLGDPRMRRHIEDALTALAAEAEGSASCPRRALLMDEPLSQDANEITDKGYVNQHAVLERRFELVERLYAEPSGPDVILARECQT